MFVYAHTRKLNKTFPRHMHFSLYELRNPNPHVNVFSGNVKDDKILSHSEAQVDRLSDS